ncbi:hypothetical protein PM082_023376 [Marasmius tenuissimus]|nr:hypothetical protein PM082_023376 [Marasmius tenuissimus]
MQAISYGVAEAAMSLDPDNLGGLVNSDLEREHDIPLNLESVTDEQGLPADGGPLSESNGPTPDLRTTIEEDEDDVGFNLDPEGNRLLDVEHGIDWSQEIPEEDEEDDDGYYDRDINETIGRGGFESMLPWVSIGKSYIMVVLTLPGAVVFPGHHLMVEDLVTLRHYAFKLERHLTREDFNALRFTFPNNNVQLWKTTKAFAEDQSNFEAQVYDCCVNLCTCFASPLSDDFACPQCKESR